MSDPTPSTHKRVTMRNVVKSRQYGRYEITNEAIDYVPNGTVESYVVDAKTRWQEVIVTNINAPAPPVSTPGVGN